MHGRYLRLIPLLLLLGLCVSVQARELQRLSPKVGRPGSAIHLLGRGFGDAMGDPAVTNLQVLHPQRNLDGSYRFGLQLQIRNLGSRGLEAERGQTRQTLRQGARLLCTGTWPGPPMNGIRFEPGRGLNLEIPFITRDPRQVAQGVLAGIALRADGAGNASG